MSNALDWQPDPLQSRIFWLQHDHFDLGSASAIGENVYNESIRFRLRSAYDVVAAPGWCIASPRQPWSEIWLIREGQVDVAQDDKKSTIYAGQIAVLTGGRSRLSVESCGKPLSILGFSFDALLWDSLDLPALLDVPLCIQPSTQSFERLKIALENLIRECRNPQSLSTLAAQSWAQLVIVEVLPAAFPDDDFDQLWRKKIPAALSPDIASTLAFITAHLDESLNLQILAREAHLSPKHFARKFKAALQVSPMEYLRRTRLERAQTLLAASDDSVGEIASRCGFEDAAHFSRVFREYSGSSPLEFRRHARAFYPKNPHPDPNAGSQTDIELLNP